MKKLGFGLSVFLFVATAFASGASAADNITESPDVKIVIGGEMGAYKDTPVIVDGRTMLPLREVLTNLGVSNDDEHIIWDGTKRSVTVKKEDTVIYLEVGKTAGNVNGNEVAIDVAPIVYAKNNRVYIPARFVAESLGKVVEWDVATRSVFIADKTSYNQVKDLLTKWNEAIKDVKKYKIDMGINLKMSSQDEYNKDFDIVMKSDVDQANNIRHSIATMNIFGAELKNDMYLKDGLYYTKDSTTGKWKKEAVSESEYAELFSSSGEISSFKDEDINKLSAGMVVSESKNPDEVVLKGNVFAPSLMNGINSIESTGSYTEDLDKSEYYLELTYDKNTYLMKTCILNSSGNIEEESGTSRFDIKANISISDYNGNFAIEVPQDAIVDNDDVKR